MAKQSGLGDNLYVQGFDVSGDVGSLSRIGGGPTALDVTPINKSGFERLGGLRDGSIDYDGFFNDDVGQLHRTLRGLPVTDRVVTYCRGTVLGGEAAGCVAKQVDFGYTRPTDGSFTLQTTAQANGFGVEWGQQLTAGKVTHGAATNGTGIDTTASVSLGGQAYLQVFAFTGTSATITVQGSADNLSFSNITGLGFTTVTAVTAERIQSGPTAVMPRYLRVASTGTFSNLQFAVFVVKNQTATVF